jgi:parvulin-like peptidyl-prolyl isomerase
MLEIIRRHKAIFSIIFILAALGLVVSMFGSGRGTIGVNTGTDVVARVYDQEIQSRELINLLNREMQRMEDYLRQQDSGQNPEQQKMMRQILMSQLNANQLLKRLIYQRFIYSTALDVGIRSAPETIREMIQEIPEFQKEGRFDPILYRQLIPRTAAFEDELRKQIASETLQKSFESSLRVMSASEIENQKWLGRKITFETLTLSASQLPEVAAPTAAQLEEFKKQADTEARIQAFYNKNISRFRQEEEVRARHILVKPDSGKDIQKIAQEIREGKISFEEAAKKYSDDASNASRGGDLGFFKRGMMVPEFEAVAFSLKSPNEVSEPVKTQFGEHLIQFVERKEASERSLDQVREEILPDVWKEEKRQSQLKELVAAWTKLPKGPTEKDLAPYKLRWETQSPWSPTDMFFAPIGNVENQIEALLSLSAEKPFLNHSLSKAESFVLLRFVKVEDGAAGASGSPRKSEAQNESALYADNKVSQAYDHFFRTRYEESEKKKKIVISTDKVAQIQQAIQQQL